MAGKEVGRKRIAEKNTPIKVGDAFANGMLIRRIDENRRIGEKVRNWREFGRRTPVPNAAPSSITTILWIIKTLSKHVVYAERNISRIWCITDTCVHHEIRLGGEQLSTWMDCYISITCVSCECYL